MTPVNKDNLPDHCPFNDDYVLDKLGTKIDTALLDSRKEMLDQMSKLHGDLLESQTSAIQSAMLKQREEFDNISIKNTHNIVNGTFDSIHGTIKEIKDSIEKVTESVDEIKERTLYGYLRLSFKERPFKTVLVLSVSGGFLVYVIYNFILNDTFSELIKALIKFFK